MIERGYRVDCYYDGESALDAAMKEHYDMLLLDVNVPEIDGFEMLEYLQEIRNRTPAIFITSLGDLKNLRKGFDLGAEDYLKSPSTWRSWRYGSSTICARGEGISGSVGPIPFSRSGICCWGRRGSELLSKPWSR
ncbi:response regulator [Nitratifractor sp.]